MVVNPDIKTTIVIATIVSSIVFAVASGIVLLVLKR